MKINKAIAQVLFKKVLVFKSIIGVVLLKKRVGAEPAFSRVSFITVTKGGKYAFNSSTNNNP